ncbi:MAG: ribosome biogenesis GTP-binding protein YihA/YsxC [Clostridia bacterium]|nr:ribosome biogenesis GTP-binding protein YihA/YsxC [Clostridia bacterium]
MLKIKNAVYIKGAADAKSFIEDEKRPIIAVSGRSNVGKSSLINRLANNGKLARVSKEPGRTRLVNYFDFGEFILADLPGYGFAKVSKEEKARWGRIMDAFFSEERFCDLVFALCDVRHEPSADDSDMINFLYETGIPFIIIATKADKLSKSQIGIRKREIAKFFGCGPGDVVVTSSVNGTGIDNLLERIENAINVKNTEGTEEDE